MTCFFPRAGCQFKETEVQAATWSGVLPNASLPSRSRTFLLRMSIKLQVEPQQQSHTSGVSYVEERLIQFVLAVDAQRIFLQQQLGKIGLPFHDGPDEKLFDVGATELLRPKIHLKLLQIVRIDGQAKLSEKLPIFRAGEGLFGDNLSQQEPATATST